MLSVCAIFVAAPGGQEFVRQSRAVAQTMPVGKIVVVNVRIVKVNTNVQRK